MATVTLEVYFTDSCWSCAETHRLVESIRPEFPAVRIDLVDLSLGEFPDQVFAVPTYVLNGRVLFLGNPERHELCARLDEAMAASLERSAALHARG